MDVSAALVGGVTGVYEGRQHSVMEARVVMGTVAENNEESTIEAEAHPPSRKSRRLLPRQMACTTI